MDLINTIGTILGIMFMSAAVIGGIVYYVKTR